LFFGLAGIALLGKGDGVFVVIATLLAVPEYYADRKGQHSYVRVSEADGVDLYITVVDIVVLILGTSDDVIAP